MTTNPYEFLKQKEIIKILDGDTGFGFISCDDGSTDCWGMPNAVNISLPYLTGSGICDLSTHFGFPMSYEAESNISRRKYFEDMLDHFIQSNRCSELLAFLFGKSQFKEKLSDFPPEKIDAYYNEIVKVILEKINSILHFSGHELKIIGQKFVVQPSGTKFEVHAPTIEKTIDRPYIADITARALQDIDAGHFDSALTKSKTLLEEVFKYVIEQKGVTPPEKADIHKQYKCVRNLYNMETNKDNDKRINVLLSGLSSIVDSVSEMRNGNSDAHGLGKARPYDLKDYHARLLVNASMILADFILAVAQNNLSQK